MNEELDKFDEAQQPQGELQLETGGQLLTVQPLRTGDLQQLGFA